MSMDRREEQDRMKDEEYRFEQDLLKADQQKRDEEELDQEEMRAYDKQIEDEEDRLQEEEYYEERMRKAEAENGFDSDLPPVAIQFDQNLYLMYLDLCSWSPPSDVLFLPTIRLDPPRLFSLVSVHPSDLWSAWGRPRMSRESIHQHLDGVVALLRKQNAEKRSIRSDH